MSGGGGGNPPINVGGVYVEIPYVDPSAPYGLRVTEISLCIAIQQMANAISEESIRTAIQSAATQGVDKEVKLLVSDADAGAKLPAFVK